MTVLGELSRKKGEKGLRERKKMRKKSALMERTRVTEEWNVQSERENRGGELRRKKGEKGLREREDEGKQRAEESRERERQSDRERQRPKGSKRDRTMPLEEGVQAEGVTAARHVESQA